MAISKVEQKKFSKEILEIQKIHDMSVMEAIVKYAEIKGVDVVAITKYIGKSLKTRLAAEARSLNLIKGKRK